jgi:hypothetical protein
MTAAAPRTVADELTYELLRDEWELLLAVGTGPTTAPAAADRVGAPVAAARGRLEVLVRYGLLSRGDDGYRMVPAFHERREGMSSFLRDLVIRRLELGSERPVAAFVREGLGGALDLTRLIDVADQTLLPAVFAAASPPATERSERYSLFFAVAADAAPPAPPAPSADEGVVGRLLDVLKAAAVQRSQPDRRDSAKLWVADMRTDPEIAEAIATLFEAFLTQAPAHQGDGAAVFALLASDPLRRES